MAIIDPNQTWVPLAERLARTTNERHRQVLGIVIEHMRAEAEPDMDRLMAKRFTQPSMLTTSTNFPTSLNTEQNVSCKISSASPV